MLAFSCFNVKNNDNVASQLKHTPKSENLESSETPTTSELDCRGQNTSL